MGLQCTQVAQSAFEKMVLGKRPATQAWEIDLGISGQAVLGPPKAEQSLEGLGPQVGSFPCPCAKGCHWRRAKQRPSTPRGTSFSVLREVCPSQGFYTQNISIKIVFSTKPYMKQIRKSTHIDVSTWSFKWALIGFLPWVHTLPSPFPLYIYLSPLSLPPPHPHNQCQIYLWGTLELWLWTRSVVLKLDRESDSTGGLIETQMDSLPHV